MSLAEQTPDARRKENSILTAVSVISAVVTVALSIGNFILKERLDTAAQALQERAQAIEESKERIARYDYVFKTLSEVDSSDPSRRTLSVNIARLALTPAEQATLFNGLAFSQDKKLAEAGRQGAALTPPPPTRPEPSPGAGLIGMPRWVGNIVNATNGNTNKLELEFNQDGSLLTVLYLIDGIIRKGEYPVTSRGDRVVFSDEASEWTLRRTGSTLRGEIYQGSRKTATVELHR